MNKFERAKQEKDGLDVFPALMRAAEVGWESLDDDDLMRLKWYGLYAHNAKDGHFMLRTKVVQGVLTADQAEVMARITDDFAPRDHRLHDPPVLPEPLADARRGPRGLLAPGEGRAHDLRRLRRHHPQRHRLHAGRHRPRAGRRRPRDRAGDPRVLPRQQALLEPPAQVQDLRHGLQGGLRARPHQRRLAVGRDPRGRHRAASTSASAAGSRARRASRARSTSSSRRRRRPRSSPGSPRSSATPTRTAPSAAARG